MRSLMTLIGSWIGRLIFLAFSVVCLLLAMYLVFEDERRSPQDQAATSRADKTPSANESPTPTASPDANQAPGTEQTSGTDKTADVDDTAVVGLMTLAAISLLACVGGPVLIRRITKVGPSGIEFDPSTRERIDEVLHIPTAPDLTYPVYSKAIGPWDFYALNGEQRWYYQAGTDALLHLQHRGIKATELGEDDLDRFRRLALGVAKAALIDDEVPKALALLKALEPLATLTSEELLFLATAYLLMSSAPYVKDRPRESQGYLEQARRCIERAAKADPMHPMIQWTLGYVYDDVGYFNSAIAANRRSVEIDGRFAPWAYWHIAISQLKMGNDHARCMASLESVPPGKWWEDIWADPELEPLKSGDHAGRFSELYEANKPKPAASS